MNNLEKLIHHFEQFPGVGARQAKRFAFHILALPKATTTDIATLITSLPLTVTECASCRRFFAKNGGENTCVICSDPARDRSKLMVVASDSDIQAVERSGTYNGLYFVLGGTVPLLESKENTKLRSNALFATVEERLKTDQLAEIILAFAVNPDGENTGRFVESKLQPLTDAHAFSLTYLGRGLSTGSELEYADPETIKNAFRNRG